MLTDTAIFRYPHYHRSDDTPEDAQLPDDGPRRVGTADAFRDPVFDANPGYEFEPLAPGSLQAVRSAR